MGGSRGGLSLLMSIRNSQLLASITTSRSQSVGLMDTLFGVVGNGIADDTVAIQRALDYVHSIGGTLNVPKGRYNFTSLTIGNCIIESDIDAVLVLTVANSNGSIKNKNYGNADFYTAPNTFKIYGLTFELKVPVTGDGVADRSLARMFQTKGLKNCVLDHCHFITAPGNTHGFYPLDLYSSTNNMMINECTWDISSIYDYDINGAVTENGTPLVTPICIREYNENSTANTITSGDITIKDCHIKKRGNDEALWIDSWFGDIDNVKVLNNVFEDSSVSNSGMSLGTWKASTSLKNVLFEGNTLIRSNMMFIMFKIQSFDGTDLENIIVRNNTFYLKTIDAVVSSKYMLYGVNVGANKSVILEGNILKSDVTIAGAIATFYKSKANILNVPATYSEINMDYSEGDIVNNTVGAVGRNINHISKITVSAATNLINNSARAIAETEVADSDITCSDHLFFDNGPAIAQTYRLRRTKVANGTKQIMYTWAVVNGPTKIIIEDCKLSNSNILSDYLMAKLTVDAETTVNDIPFGSTAPLLGWCSKDNKTHNTNPTAGSYSGWVCTTAGYMVTTAWVASTAYSVNAVRYYGANVYKCTVAGTSGTVAPTHTTGTAVDGTVTWAYISPLAVFKGISLIQS